MRFRDVDQCSSGESAKDFVCFLLVLASRLCATGSLRSGQREAPLFKVHHIGQRHRACAHNHRGQATRDSLNHEIDEGEAHQAVWPVQTRLSVNW